MPDDSFDPVPKPIGAEPSLPRITVSSYFRLRMMTPSMMSTIISRIEATV